MHDRIFRETHRVVAGVCSAGSGSLLGYPSSNAPGIIHVDVDETRAPQQILHTHLTMPVQPGPLVLYYPEWIPGEHMPDGPINNIAGLKFSPAKNRFPGGAICWICLRFISRSRRAIPR